MESGNNNEMFNAIIKSLLSGNDNGQMQMSEDDKTFRTKTTQQISVRDNEYTLLLRHFGSITKARNILKEVFKWLFCIMVMVSVIVLIIIVYRLFDKTLSFEMSIITQLVPLLITSMVGFVSAIIAIPLTITKYLFSTKEDENITQIIMHTQEHDMSGRKWASNVDESSEQADIYENDRAC